MSAGRHLRQLSTKTRLVAAFSAVLAAFVSALALQIASLRQMDTTLGAMKAQENRMRLTLQLEDAVREQYGMHDEALVTGDVAHLVASEGARARALELTRTLGDLVGDPDSVARIARIRDAIAGRDRMFRDPVEVDVRHADLRVAIAHERRYPLLLLVEDDLDRIFGRLQQTTAAFREQLVELQTSALRWTAALLVVTPLLVAAAVLYLSRSIARPLARLSEGAAAVAAGDLDVRIAVDTPDEFGALAAKFNAMTVALKQHQERLVRSEKLAGIGRLAAGVAHELNNPLQVMLGYLSLHRDETDRRLAEHLAAVEDETLRCKEIVEGLLELSRPATMLARVRVDLRLLCEDVAAKLRISGRADASRPSVEGAAVVIADRAKLRQIVFNLMNNAVEAAGPAGHVEVCIGASGGMVELSVRDSGPGVAPEARARLFEPFFTTKPAGTGLGLAVSRSIARAHGGDIEVQGAAGGGAVFTLRLPRAPEEEVTT